MAQNSEWRTPDHPLTQCLMRRDRAALRDGLNAGHSPEVRVTREASALAWCFQQQAMDLAAELAEAGAQWVPKDSWSTELSASAALTLHRSESQALAWFADRSNAVIERACQPNPARPESAWERWLLHGWWQLAHALAQRMAEHDPNWSGEGLRQAAWVAASRLPGCPDPMHEAVLHVGGRSAWSPSTVVLEHQAHCLVPNRWGPTAARVIDAPWILQALLGFSARHDRMQSLNTLSPTWLAWAANAQHAAPIDWHGTLRVQWERGKDIHGVSEITLGTLVQRLQLTPAVQDYLAAQAAFQTLHTDTPTPAGPRRCRL